MTRGVLKLWIVVACASCESSDPIRDPASNPASAEQLPTLDRQEITPLLEKLAGSSSENGALSLPGLVPSYRASMTQGGTLVL